MVAEVIVDIARSEVDKIFDYTCDGSVAAGSRVEVPFGAQGKSSPVQGSLFGKTAPPKTVTGFVMRVKETSDYPAEKLKPIGRVLDRPLTEETLELAAKIARRYRVPMALCLRLFLPPELRAGKVSEKYRNYVRLAPNYAQVEIKKGARRQQELIAYLEAHGEESSAALGKMFGSALAALTGRGAVVSERRRAYRDPYRGEEGRRETKVLTAAQRNAVDAVLGTEKTVTLIHGVTGSGKTEVYLTLIARAIAEGKSAIFLVPEISLTPQMLSQLRARFGSMAAILHSGLSAGERFDEWQRLRDGVARIAIGARSAIFAPVENVGVIVIDEEHDGSYSSETAPRYNTFDVAYLRARFNRCKMVLGSATPSVETYRRAEEGQYALVKLPERINARPMPEVHLIDMRREVRRGNPSPFSAALREGLQKCLRQGNQAIIFLNRRGYSQTVLCRDCGYFAKCSQCDVSLTYHSEEDCLKCHYCGARYRVPQVCPSCGGKHIGYVGTGTQRVVYELKKLFPAARILRMDMDTTSGKEGHLKILKEFSSHKADFLVGTQMVAKGHDFPLVTLVGILDADMSLHFADYRSGERTFQLVTQVAGRSGRAQDPGEVILQTYEPENYILRFAAQYDYEGFYRHEISMREATMFPPFARIVRVMVTGEKEDAALAALKDVYEKLRALFEEKRDCFLFFNRMHSPIKRIKKQYRYQVLMRLADSSVLEEIYALTAEKYKDVLVYVEENPSNLS